MFLFQAEDGIRDLVRSRGLGDVYKRQHQQGAERGHQIVQHDAKAGLGPGMGVAGWINAMAVSYTHLTLPTSELV